MATENLQRVALLRREFTRNVVDYAQSAEGLPFGGNQRRAGVKAQFRSIGYQRIVGKALILQGIRNDEDIGTADCMCAKSPIARSFTERQTDLCLKPLPVSINEAD